MATICNNHSPTSALSDQHGAAFGCNCYNTKSAKLVTYARACRFGVEVKSIRFVSIRRRFSRGSLQISINTDTEILAAVVAQCFAKQLLRSRSKLFQYAQMNSEHAQPESRPPVQQIRLWRTAGTEKPRRLCSTLGCQLLLPLSRQSFLLRICAHHRNGS